MIRSIALDGDRARRLNTTPAQRARWVRRFRNSGLSQQAFARKHHLAVSTLGVWIKKTKPSADPNSQPVPLSEVSLPALLSPWAAEVTQRNGTTVRLSAPIARELLPKLLRAC